MGSNVNISCVFNSTLIAPIWVINNMSFDQNGINNLPGYQYIGNFDNGIGDYLLRALSVNMNTTFMCRLTFPTAVDSPLGTVTISGM